MRLTLEFGGGLDALFDGQRSVEADVPAAAGGAGGAAASLTVAGVLAWTRDKLLRERPELFMKGDTIRPGVLVLINDEDWELSGTLASAVEEGDRITFISTLHGG